MTQTQHSPDQNVNIKVINYCLQWPQLQLCSFHFLAVWVYQLMRLGKAVNANKES